MKRGNDDQKIMGPMFPRLHVNDTEKGGPRAPPRNKMALYEQLSIPSQRFNNGILPLNSNNTGNLVPPASSSQRSGFGRGMLFPPRLPPSHSAEKLHTIYSDLNTPLVQLEHNKKLDEDDFTVPIFVQSGMNQDRGNYNGTNKELSSLNPAYLGSSMKTQSSCDKESNLRQEGRNQNEGNSREIVSGRKQFVKSTSSQSSTEKCEGLLKQANLVSGYEHRGCLVNSNGRLPDTDCESQQECRAESPLDNSACDVLASIEPIKGISNGASSLPMRESQSEEKRIPNNHIIDIDSYEDRACRSVRTGNVDREDDVSETSMVDSISGLDISPDDVVGIIGQKHFWKARRAIINQQRVFAVQVFELHRLIKVQRLIAGSPHLLIEDNAYLGRPLKGSPAKKLPLEYVLKSPSKIGKHKDDSDKPNHKMECSAENTIGKMAFSSLQNSTQPSNNRQFSGNDQPTAVNMDPKLNPWCFHQPPGHQWLVPIMSPSEGLVYKPYASPGFTSPVCGGCGSPGSTPIMGNFLNPAHGHPASHHLYQGMGVAPFAPLTGHGYFPPYGMPVMYPTISGSAVEQINHFTGPGLHGQFSGGGANVNVQHQRSSSVLSQKNSAVANVFKLHASKDSEVQISTASSPSEKMQSIGITNTTESRNALPLFPTSPAVNGPDVAPQQHEGSQPARVIKVVPHNAISATESAARIFKSIQEERKQHDSV